MKSKKGTIIFVGHLVPELDIRFDIAVVLRLDLEKLLKRLKERKYQRDKIAANIIAETLDYCGENVQADEKFEVEANKQINKITSYIIARLESKKSKKPNSIQINKLEQLKKFVKKHKEFGL